MKIAAPAQPRLQSRLMRRLSAAFLIAFLLGGVLAVAAAAELRGMWAGVRWGEPSGALVAQFAGRATMLPWAIDYGDSYVTVVLRDVLVGGVRMIAYFQMDKRTGGLKRIQLERPQHGVNPPAARAVLFALAAEYGRPEAACSIGAGPANGYQQSAEWLWRRDGATIRAIFRDTTIEAVEGCLFRPLTAGPCGLTGRFLVRVSPPGGDRTPCSPPPPSPPRVK